MAVLEVAELSGTWFQYESGEYNELERWNVLVRASAIPERSVSSVQSSISSCPDYRNASFVFKRLELLRLCGFSGPVLVITDGSKVDDLVGELRWRYPRKLVGSLQRHQWMVLGLDLVLATAEEACQFAAEGCMSTTSFVGLVIDNLPSLTRAVIIDVKSSFWDVLGTHCQPRQVIKPLRHLVWPRPHIEDKFLAILKEQLPEAANCPGLCDRVFCGMVHFASTVFEDWSGVVAALPGLENEARDVSLLLAPLPRVLSLKRLVDEFAVYMGHASSCVMVGTPGSFAAMELHNVHRVLIVEASKLDTGEVEAIIRRMPAQTLANFSIHSPTPRLEQLALERRGCYKIPSAEVTVKGVIQFHQVLANEQEKLERVCSLWKQLCLTRVVVFCNEPDRVADVLRLQGVEVRSTSQAMDSKTAEELGSKHVKGVGVLVTNRYFRGVNMVINLDLPCSPSEYLQRMGLERRQNVKLVINLVTEAEQSLLDQFLTTLHSSTSPLPDNCRHLLKRSVKKYIHDHFI